MIGLLRKLFKPEVTEIDGVTQQKVRAAVGRFVGRHKLERALIHRIDLKEDDVFYVTIWATKPGALIGIGGCHVLELCRVLASIVEKYVKVAVEKFDPYE